LDQDLDIDINAEALSAFYSSYFQYYTTLSPQGKQRFAERCLYFIKEKTIVGAEGFTINNKVRAIIAASAVQLTLGLDTWDYDYFMQIIIHPQKFLNKPTQQHFKGETNLQGYIKLSWLSFINGYKDGKDNVNLGIHEFSHALRFNSIRGNEQDYYTKYFFTMWLSTAYEAYYHIKQGKESIFRDYGGANINEFISVCFEHYFESPQQIKQAYPHLYYNTAILLNQVTEGNVTNINVREQMMLEKSKLLSPLKQRAIKQRVIDSNSVPLIIISTVIMIFTMVVSGVFSGPVVVLLGICICFYLRLDANMISLYTNGQQLEIKKGFLLLKNWQKHSFALSHLVNVEYSDLGNLGELGMLFYNTADDHFYEEVVQCDKAYATELLSEFKANKIAISRL
jgi:Mlc titration factor MtfA (ptsG expression regulator)